MARLVRAKYTLAYRKWLANLADARRRRGLTQQRVSELVGVPHRLIGMIENGEWIPNPILLLEVAALCGVSLSPRCQRNLCSALPEKKERTSDLRKNLKPKTVAPRPDFYLKIEVVGSDGGSPLTRFNG